MKIKVCGTRDVENIGQLLQLPVDFIGFVFYPRSPRFAGGDEEKGVLRKWINSNLEKFGEIKRVGVFVNAEIEEVLNKVHDYQLDFIQLHGAERPEYCRELTAFWEVSSMRNARLIRAFSVDSDFDFSQTDAYHGTCSLFIFDTKGEDHGGMGRRFDWSLLEKYYGPTPFLLAGGIGPDSVREIQQFRHPQFLGVDINSRFEKEPGLKDVELVREFAASLKI